MNSAALTLLEEWLAGRLTPTQQQWFEERLAAQARSNSDRELHITLGMIPRKLGRAELALDQAALSAADQARTGWDPSTWTVETAARVRVFCLEAARRGDDFGSLYADLCRNADLNESLTLFAALPLLPADAQLDAQVGDGLRSNMRAVFEAIAHRNPYPRECFDDNRWNHMVLKALFVDSTLAPIQGLDERANEELALILIDYAHERWAAKRAVTPELWRCVGPFASGARLDDLNRVRTEGSIVEQQAALLALAASPDPAAHEQLAQHPDTAARIAVGTLSWASLPF